ncbi:MAG: hypothetical protein ACRD18_00875 [Terriglobia bacterium]
MRFNRLLLTAFMVVFLLPISALADGILDFNIPVNPLLANFLQITSVEGQGGTANSGVTLPVTNGSLDLMSGGWSWSSGGTLVITATGTIGPLNLTGTLLQGSFTGVTPSFQHGGLELTLDGFSAAINTSLAGYYGLSSSAINGNVYISGDGSSAILAVDPVVAATEGGGVPATLIVLLAAALCFAVSVRLKIISPAF